MQNEKRWNCTLFTTILLSIVAILGLIVGCGMIIGGAVMLVEHNALVREDVNLYNNRVDLWKSSSAYTACKAYSTPAFYSTFGSLQRQEVELGIDWESFGGPKGQNLGVETYEACYYRVNVPLGSLGFATHRDDLPYRDVEFEGNTSKTNLTYPTFRVSSERTDQHCGYNAATKTTSCTSAKTECHHQRGGFYIDNPTGHNCFHLFYLWKYCALVDFSDGRPSSTPVSSCLGAKAAENQDIFEYRIVDFAHYTTIDSKDEEDLMTDYSTPESYSVTIELRSELDPMLVVAELGGGRMEAATLSVFGGGDGLMIGGIVMVVFGVLIPILVCVVGLLASIAGVCLYKENERVLGNV